MYCNRPCLFVCVCVCVYLWVCYHDNSKLRATILTKLGFAGKSRDYLQLIKFWPSRAPGKGVCGGAKFLATPWQRTVFASPPSAVFRLYCSCMCVWSLPSRFVLLLAITERNSGDVWATPAESYTCVSYRWIYKMRYYIVLVLCVYKYVYNISDVVWDRWPQEKTGLRPKNRSRSWSCRFCETQSCHARRHNAVVFTYLKVKSAKRLCLLPVVLVLVLRIWSCLHGW